MEKLYYVPQNAYSASEVAIKEILSRDFNIRNVEISRTENGKPYLKKTPFPLYFSLSHTDETLFIALSNEEIGIDAEPLNRTVNFLPIVRKFSVEEQNIIKTRSDFLKHWTAKESAVKFLGSTLAKDLKNLHFDGVTMSFQNAPLGAKICFKMVNDTLVCVCAKNDFERVQAEAFP